MTISWNTPIDEKRFDEDQLLTLSHDLMPLYGMDAEEYCVRNDSIHGSPDMLRFNRFVTPFRVAVYDVMVIPHQDQQAVILRFRMYKGIAVAVMFWLITALLYGSMWSWENIVLPACAFLICNGFASLFILSTKQEAIEIVRRWGKTTE